MFAKRFFYVCAGVLVTCGPARAITLHQPGYVAAPLVTLPVTYYSPSDIELDGAGNLYIPTLLDGVQ